MLKGRLRTYLCNAVDAGYAVCYHTFMLYTYCST